MAIMNLSLPDPLKDWVDAHARSERYTDPSDYVRDLIRLDQERVEKIAHLQTLVTEALDSGISDQSMDDIEEAARREGGL